VDEIDVICVCGSISAIIVYCYSKGKEAHERIERLIKEGKLPKDGWDK